MPKRKPAFEPEQLGFSFAAPAMLSTIGALAGLDRVIASAVGQALRGDGRTRYEVAAATSQLLDEDVSKLMLDAYASESRDSHNISAARFLALIAATRRYDILDAIVRRIGAGLLVGEEIHLAEIGHLETQRREIEARLRSLKAETPPLSPETRSGRG